MFHNVVPDGSVRRIASAELVPTKPKEDYLPGKLDELIIEMAFSGPLILKGGKGSGKTMSLHNYAFMHGVPMLRRSCTSGTTERHLFGGNVIKSLDESFFVLGSLAAAIDVANEMGQCLLVLEEINALDEEVQKAVNGIADYRQEIDLDHVGMVMRLRQAHIAREAGEVVSVAPESKDTPHLYEVIYALGGEVVEVSGVPEICIPAWVQEGFKFTAGTTLIEAPKLWVVGTMNPGYGGTYDLNEDFRSRFRFLEVPYLAQEREEKILLSMLPGKPSAAEKNFISKLLKLAEEFRGQKTIYSLSTRDLEQCVQDLVTLKKPARVLKLLEGKFRSTEVDNFRARIKSVFDVDLTTTKLL